jgi:hypothetical protein
MDFGEIDRLIGQLATSGYAIEKLELLGEPALRRLFDVVNGTVTVPTSGDLKDSFTQEAVVLGRLGAKYRELLLALVEGRTNLKFGVIQALGFTGNARLKAVAKEALTTFGN